MKDNKLVCVLCDAVAAVHLSYEGYVARCGCDHFSLSPGSDRPPQWEKLEDVDSPTNFSVKQKGAFYGNEQAEENRVVCLRCSDEDSVEIEIEDTDLEGFDKKVTFTCTTDHGKFGHENESTAYYVEADYDFDTVREVAG